MRKSTDSAFRICGSHRGTYDQKYSYCSSKSGQVGKSGFVPENTGCQKKWMRAQFLKKSLFLLRGFFKYHLKTSLRRNKLLKKNERASFFFDIPYFPWRTHFCRPVLTLSCDNYSFDHLHPYVTHIFGIVSPCSFWWYYPWKKISSQKCRGEGTLAKNAVFGHFPCRPPLSKVKNCYSDNFNARWLPHGSFEPLWAIVKWQH